MPDPVNHPPVLGDAGQQQPRPEEVPDEGDLGFGKRTTQNALISSILLYHIID